MGNQITQIKNDTVETVENIGKTRCNCKCNCFVSNSEDDEQAKNIPINLTLKEIEENRKNLVCNIAIKKYNELIEINCKHYLESKINCCQKGTIFAKTYKGYQNKYLGFESNEKWIVLDSNSIQFINEDSKKYFDEYDKKTILELEFLFKKGCCFSKGILEKKIYELGKSGLNEYF